jgi:23S rRNA pseudouridine1911/1915/1917 synthase
MRYTKEVYSFHARISGRLDIAVANDGGVTSRIKARDLIRGGAVMVNGRVARKAAMIVEPEDVIEMSATGEPVTETRLDSHDLQLDVIYEDDTCMVLNKPAGIPVHPGAGIPRDAATILHGVAHLFKERKIPFASASVLVHRLDKDTTGCLLIAKTPAAHKALQAQFEKRTVRKFYLALVAGIPQPPAAVIDASIGRSTSDRTKMTIMGSSKTREARTTYRTLATANGAALLSCELHTGRTHQIRVHLHGIGHSILGDPTYHSIASTKLSAQSGIDFLCLHAWKLTFVSPADDAEHEISAPPPQQMEDALQRIGIGRKF